MFVIPEFETIPSKEGAKADSKKMVKLCINIREITPGNQALAELPWFRLSSISDIHHYCQIFFKYVGIFSQQIIENWLRSSTEFFAIHGFPEDQLKN